MSMEAYKKSMNFHENYYESIYQGLSESLFYKNNQILDANLFFGEIKDLLKNIYELKKSKLIFLGNGASSAFANHMALDFSKNGKLISRSLSDSALLTALSNDFSYEDAFVEFLKIEDVGVNDLVITISSSGNSKNIINSLVFCQENNIKTLALSGLNPDNLSIKNSTYSIFVPKKTYGIVECNHQIFLHLILDYFMDIKEWEKDESQNMNIKFYKL